MDILKFWQKKHFKQFVVGFTSLCLLVTLNFYRLASITNNKLSQPEVEAVKSSLSGRIILENPLFLPYKLLTYLFLKLNLTTVFSLRLVTALFGILLVIFFYFLIKRWFSPKIALLTSLLLATSNLYLNYARLAVPYILVPLGLLVLLWATWWIYQSKVVKTKLLIASLLIILCLYIPGLIWFCLIIVLLQKNHLKTMFKGTPKNIISASVVLSLVLLFPLIIASIQQPKIFFQLLAIPTSINLIEFLNNLVQVPISLIVRSEFNPVFGLGRLPYLDIVTVCLAILGTYAFVLRYKLMRTKALVSAIIIAWILISFENQIKIIILLPVIYIVVAGGIMFLLQQWYSVFPNNPISKFVTICLLSSILTLSVYYNSLRYFVAWANNPLSQQAFQLKVKSISDTIDE